MTNINNAVGTSPPTALIKKVYHITIIAKSPLVGQSQSYDKLTQAIHRRDLTTSLGILEASGIKENLAIFILANLQNLGVAV